MVGVPVNNLAEARMYGEQMIGRKLTDQEFEECREYAEHKAKMTGHEPDYALLLLPDVISERDFSERTLELYRLTKEVEDSWIRYFRQVDAKRSVLSGSVTPMFA